MKITLKKMSTGPASGLAKAQAKKKTKKMIAQLCEYQHKMYADNTQSVLIVMQGLDAAGKDGAITKVLGAINPMGCSVKSFGVPTKEESAHDFLWRIHKEAPAEGMMKVFNRSHYEDLVMPLMNGSLSKKDYEKRVEAVKNFEKLLTDNGTHIIKVYFHVGAEKQKEKLEERLTNKEKHWKHKDADWDKAAKYEDYLKVYSDVISDTSFDFAEWTVIGSDKNYSKEYEFAELVLNCFKKMKLSWPALETDMHIIKAAKEKKSEKKNKKIEKYEDATKKYEDTTKKYEDTTKTYEDAIKHENTQVSAKSARKQQPLANISLVQDILVKKNEK